MGDGGVRRSVRGLTALGLREAPSSEQREQQRRRRGVKRGDLFSFLQAKPKRRAPRKRVGAWVQIQPGSSSLDWAGSCGLLERYGVLRTNKCARSGLIGLG